MKMMRQILMATTAASTVSALICRRWNDRGCLCRVDATARQWQGTLDKSDGTSVNLQLNYTSKSNGSALLEESSEDDVEMLNIFNIQEGTVVSTHYCGLMNKPVSKLVSAEGGVIKLKTDAAAAVWKKAKTSTWIVGRSR